MILLLHFATKWEALKKKLSLFVIYDQFLHTVHNLTTHARHGVTPLSLTDFSKTAIFSWMVREAQSKASPGQLQGGGRESGVPLLVTTLASEKQGNTGAIMAHRGGGLGCIIHLSCSQAATLHPALDGIITDKCNIIWLRNLERTLWLLAAKSRFLLVMGN